MKRRLTPHFLTPTRASGEDFGPEVGTGQVGTWRDNWAGRWHDTCRPFNI